MAILIDTQITGSLNVTNGINATGGFTGSLVGSASYSINALSASYAPTQNIDVSTYLSSSEFNNWTGSNLSQFSGTSSYALSASYALNGGGSGTGLNTGSTYPITSSWSNNAVSASYVPTQNIDVSTYLSSSQFTSWVSSSTNLFSGTASYANIALSASYALNGGGGGGTTLNTGSTYPITSSWANNSITSSYLMPSVSTLTDQAVIQTDTSLATHFRVTLAGNRTLGNPTGSIDALRISWEFIQDGVGGRTLSLDSKFVTGSDFNVVLNQTASKRDFLTAMYNSGTDAWYVLGFTRGY